MPGYTLTHCSNVIPWPARSGTGSRSSATAAPLPLTSSSIPSVPMTPGLLISFPAETRWSRPSPSMAWTCALTLPGLFMVTESQLRLHEGCTRPSRSTATITESPVLAVCE